MCGLWLQTEAVAGVHGTSAEESPRRVWVSAPRGPGYSPAETKVSSEGAWREGGSHGEQEEGKGGGREEETEEEEEEREIGAIFLWEMVSRSVQSMRSQIHLSAQGLLPSQIS